MSGKQQKMLRKLFPDKETNNHAKSIFKSAPHTAKNLSGKRKWQNEQREASKS